MRFVKELVRALDIGYEKKRREAQAKAVSTKATQTFAHCPSMIFNAALTLAARLAQGQL